MTVLRNDTHKQRGGHTLTTTTFRPPKRGTKILYASVTGSSENTRQKIIYAKGMKRNSKDNNQVYLHVR